MIEQLYEESASMTINQLCGLLLMGFASYYAWEFLAWLWHCDHNNDQ